MTQREETVTVEDLGEVWRIDVTKAYVGLQLEPYWGAQAMSKGPTGRWRRRGKMVVNKDGPIQAASDLLSVIDLGILQ